MKSLNRNWRGVRKIAQIYWDTYGGHDAFQSSPYAIAALIFTIFCFPLWLLSAWWELGFQIIPNLIGFTASGFAIFVAFGDDTFRKILANRETLQNKKPSPYLVVSATFMHFIVAQTIALILAIGGKNLNKIGRIFYEKADLSGEISVGQIFGTLYSFVGYFFFRTRC